jgi:hypothetical protein
MEIPTHPGNTELGESEMDTEAQLDDLQHSLINAALRDALAACMTVPHNGIIALRPNGEAWRLHWLAGPTARLADRFGAGYGIAASLDVLAAEYARSTRATVPGLAGIGLLTTAPGKGEGLTGYAITVAAARVHTLRWAAGATAPTWRIRSAANADGDTTSGLAALLDALRTKEVS